MAPKRKRPKNSKQIIESSKNMENVLECDVYTQDVSVLPSSSTCSVVNNIADANDDNGEALLQNVTVDAADENNVK